MGTGLLSLTPRRRVQLELSRPSNMLVVGTLWLAACQQGTVGPSGSDSTFSGRGSAGACNGAGEVLIAPFGDPNLEASVRAALGVSPQVELTCGLTGSLTDLDASAAGILSLEGIGALTGLRNLALWGNAITDITPLEGLTGLRTLSLRSNSIGDIGPLAGLVELTSLDVGENSVTEVGALQGVTGLTWLGLEGNQITDLLGLGGLTGLEVLILRNNTGLADLQPLVANVGLGAGDTVWLQQTDADCEDVATLQARGVLVQSDCP